MPNDKAVETQAPVNVEKHMSELEAQIHGTQTDDGAKPDETVTTDNTTVETETTDEHVTVETTAGEEIEIDLGEDITVSAEGKLVFRADPEDPNGTFYTGKDAKELFANIRNGIKAKDETIRKVKTAERITAPEETIRKIMKGKVDEDVTSTPLPVPDENAIIKKHCDAAKISPVHLNWTNEQWKEWAKEKNIESWEVMEYRQMVKDVRTAANNEIQDANVEYINSNALIAETAEVEDLLAESGIDPDKFDYEAVLESVTKDPNNRQANGILKPGKIVKAASVAILKLSKSTTKTKLQEEVDRTIVEGEEARERIAAAGNGGTRIRIPNRETDKRVPKNSEDALQQALAEYKAQQKVKSGRL